MSNREEQTFDQSPSGTDDEDTHIQPSESQDIHNRNGITPEFGASYSEIQDENPTSELEEDLNNGLAKLNIDDVNKLSEKIQETKERIKEYREDGKKEETQKKMQILTQLKRLKLLDDTLTDLKSTPSVEGSSSVMELYRLEQEVINRMEKLNIDDKNKLPEKIRQTKKRIENYRKDDKKEETEKEMQMLMPLKHLKLLDDTITELKSTRWVEESNSVIELCWHEQELINGLEQLKVDDVNKLSKEIQQNEKRIKYYREVGKEEETKKEEQISTQLKHLTLLNGTITKLKSTRLVESSSSVMEPRPLEQELATLPERWLTNSGHEVEPNDHFTKSEGNKRFCSNGASNQAAKRFREASQTTSIPQFFVHLSEVKPVRSKTLRVNIQQKYRRLCGWTQQGFPGSHPVRVHRGNYEKISESSYMVTWKSVGKRYMMLIEEAGKVYMLDQGDCLFTIDHIQFPYDAKYTCHLKDTLVDGEFIIDDVDGLFKPSFWINDIITYNGQNVSTKPLPDRLRLISQSIVSMRDSAVTEGHIKKTTQPFSIRSKYFVGLSEVNKLLSPKFLATIPHRVEGLLFLPEKDLCTSGRCPHVLKWKENETIDFLLKSSDDSSKIDAHLFLSRMDVPFATMHYLPNWQEYDNKIISCSYKDSQWHFDRLRDDRRYPNSLQTAMDIMDAVQRPVTREVLCDLIKNQSKDHVHGDNSSPTT